LYSSGDLFSRGSKVTGADLKVCNVCNGEIGEAPPKEEKIALPPASSFAQNLPSFGMNLHVSLHVLFRKSTNFGLMSFGRAGSHYVICFFVYYSG
jgi:hypothetical protein